MADGAHVCRPRSIFFAAHVAEENDWTSLRLQAQTLRGLFDKPRQAAFPFLHFLSFSPFFKEGGAAWRKFWDQRHWLFCSEKHAKLCASLQFFVVLPVKI